MTPEVTLSGAYDSRPDTWEHIHQVQCSLQVIAQDLIDRGWLHDRSKLAEPEVSIFNEFTPKLRDSTYGSDEYHGFCKSMGAALDHHYAENDHHPEHFEDGIHGMNLVQLVEMLCDWAAAVKRHADGDLRRSIEVNQERFGYSDELKRILHNTVDYMLELARD